MVHTLQRLSKNAKKSSESEGFEPSFRFMIEPNEMESDFQLSAEVSWLALG